MLRHRSIWFASCALLLVGACDGKKPASGSTPPPDEPPASEPPTPEPSPEPTPSPDEPPAGETCGEQTCTPPQQCLSYYGIAGASGPKFESCEIPCKEGKGGCPDGMECITIADGPGSVCRAPGGGP